MPSGDRIWKAVVAGLCGSIAHSLLMYFKSWAGLLPSFQPYDSLQTTLSHVTGSANPSGSALVTFIPEWLNHHQFCLWTSLSMAARQRWCDQRNDIRCARMGDYGTGFLSSDRPWVLRTPGWTRHFTRTVLAGNASNLFTHTLTYGALDLLGGKGDETFMAPVEYQLSQVFRGFGVADFNGDGIDDVVAINAGNGATTGQGVENLISLFTSKGDGTLLPEVQFGSGGIFPAGINGNALATADFNNDGAVDIVGNISGVGAGVLMNSNGTKVVLGSSSGTSHQGRRSPSRRQECWRAIVSAAH